MTCSTPSGGPQLGQAVAWPAIPTRWTVERTGVAMAGRPLASPVWRVVRVRPSAEGWLVTVAAFRA